MVSLVQNLFPTLSTVTYTTTETEQKTSASLRNLLHASMQTLHTEARANPFLNSLIKGTMDCSKVYVQYLCNLFWVHQALEASQERILETYKEPIFVFCVLFRSEKLLADIKLWSIFNPTALHFADIEISSKEFLENIKEYVQPPMVNFVNHLEAITREDPIWALGALYALYGTIMSGGQFVKKGVQQAFLTRIDTLLEEYQTHTLDKGEEDTLLRATILENLTHNPDAKERLVKESGSLFSFDPPDFEIAAFKKEWHAALDAVPEKLYLYEKEARQVFEERLVLECNLAIRAVLDTIASLQPRKLA